MKQMLRETEDCVDRRASRAVVAMIIAAGIAVAFIFMQRGQPAGAVPCQGLSCNSEVRQAIEVGASPSFWGHILAPVPVLTGIAILGFFICKRLLEKNQLMVYFEDERRSLIPIEAVPERESLEPLE
jgi:hypothetical protein